MARKKTLFKLDENREITIKELRLREIAENGKLISSLSTEFSYDKLQDVLNSILPSCIEGISKDELMDLAPSEIKEIWEGFEKVNAVFLDTVNYQESKTLFLKVVSAEIKKIHSEIQKNLREIEANQKSEENQATQPNNSSIPAPA